MNELSWLIYLASVCEDLNWICGLVGIIGAIAFSVCLLWGIMARTMGFETDTKEVLAPALFKTGKNVAWIWGAAMLVGAATPGANTLYAMAASEMGERVISSETGGKAVEALNAWLDRQIAPKAAVSE